MGMRARWGSEVSSVFGGGANATRCPFRIEQVFDYGEAMAQTAQKPTQGLAPARHLE